MKIWQMKLLAAAMRRMPCEIRRVACWWSRLYERSGGGGYDESEHDAKWPVGLQAPIRARHHAYRLELDLSDWLERRLFFSGAYYQEDVEQLLLRFIRSGDQFVDVGANIGITTLISASRFGATGRGYAFEPNPEMAVRLRRHLALNSIDNVQVLPYALAEQDGTATLSLPGNHSGRGTLTGQPKTDARSLSVEMRCGDDLLRGLDPRRPTVIKMDVEGYECRALRGMSRTLDLPGVAILVEVTDHLLRRIGDSALLLYEQLWEKGFEPFRIQLRQSRWGRTLRLLPASGPDAEEQYDALFVKRNSEFRSRLQSFGVIRELSALLE